MVVRVTVRVLVVTLVLVVQLAAEHVDGRAVHDGRRVELHPVVVGLRRHALAVVRVSAAGHLVRGHGRRGRRLIVVRLRRLGRCRGVRGRGHRRIVSRRSGVHDHWLGSARAQQ